MNRWKYLYGKDERLGYMYRDTPVCRYRCKPTEIFNPITGNYTVRGETKASAISNNSTYEKYGKGLGMSIINPKFGIHVAELLRKNSSPRVDKATFEETIGYPDPTNEMAWIKKVCEILAELGNLPVVIRGRKLPIRRFDQRVCLAAMDTISDEPAPSFYYIGTEGYFEFAKIARSVDLLFEKEVRITNLKQYDYWCVLIDKYLCAEKEGTV